MQDSAQKPVQPSAASPNRHGINPLTGAIFGAALALPLAAIIAFTANSFALPNPMNDLFEKVSRALPGSLVTFGIDSMVSIFSKVPGVTIDVASKNAEKALAVLQFLSFAAIVGAIIAWVLRRTKITPAYLGLYVTIVPLIITLLVENFNQDNPNGPLTASAWVIVLYGAWGMILGTVLESWAALSSPARVGTPPDSSRRRFLISVGGGAAAVTVVASGAGKLFGASTGNQTSPVIASGPTETSTPMMSTPNANGTAEVMFVPAPGTRPETTPNNQFYRVDVDLDFHPVDVTTWHLDIGGLVDNTYSLSYSQLRDLPAAEQDATLECISNPPGGDLISSTHWTGVKLADLLAKAGVKAGVVEIMFTCNDGYTESLPLASAMDPETLIAYATNGASLAPEHGFPARLYTPNRYGMKNPKWLTKIEAIGAPVDGYWTQRGWDKQAIVKSTSIIDAAATDQVKDGVVPVGGIAFAGSRQISKVEVQVDGGDWQPAVLKPALSPLTWRLWRFDWKAAAGHHTLVVRATDGTGALQISAPSPLHPTGASGYVSQDVNV